MEMDDAFLMATAAPFRDFGESPFFNGFRSSHYERNNTTHRGSHHGHDYGHAQDLLCGIYNIASPMTSSKAVATHSNFGADLPPVAKDSQQKQTMEDSSLIGCTIEFTSTADSLLQPELEGENHVVHHECGVDDNAADHASEVSSLTNPRELAYDPFGPEAEAHLSFCALRDSSLANDAHRVTKDVTQASSGQSSCTSKPRSIFGTYWTHPADETSAERTKEQVQTAHSASTESSSSTCRQDQLKHATTSTLSPRSVARPIHEISSSLTNMDVATGERLSQPMQRQSDTNENEKVIKSEEGDHQRAIDDDGEGPASIGPSEAAPQDPYDDGNKADASPTRSPCIWNPFASKPKAAICDAPLNTPTQSNTQRRPTWWNKYWADYNQQTDSQFALRPSTSLSSDWWKTVSDPSLPTYRSPLRGGTCGGLVHTRSHHNMHQAEDGICSAMPQANHGLRRQSDTHLARPSVQLRSCLRRGRYTNQALQQHCQQAADDTAHRRLVHFNAEIEVRPFLTVQEWYAPEGWAKTFE